MRGKRGWECRRGIKCFHQGQWAVRDVLGWSMGVITVGWAEWHRLAVWQ